ncbi:hemolysin E, partial [Escherichia coli]
DRNRSHWSTSKTPSYTKSVSWQHHPNKDIDAAKLKLTTEIAAIGEIKTETETTRFYVDYDDLMLSLLKEAAKKMINTCNEYQKRHGKKTLFEVPEV